MECFFVIELLRLLKDIVVYIVRTFMLGKKSCLGDQSKLECGIGHICMHFFAKNVNFSSKEHKSKWPR